MVYVERMGGWSEGSPIQSSQKGNGVSSRLVVSAVSKALIGHVQLIVDTKLLAPYPQANPSISFVRGSTRLIDGSAETLILIGDSRA